MNGIGMSDPQYGSPAVTETDLNTPTANGALVAEFFLDAVQSEEKSAESGRPIFEEKEHIEIRQVGNLREIRRRQIRESDKRRFPREYAAFKQGLETPSIGTPLDKLPFLNRSQVAEFKAIGIRTAEQLVNISDAEAGKFMGYQQLKQRVVDFLAAAAGNAPLSAMRSQVEARDAEIATMKQQYEAMQKQLTELLSRSEPAEKSSDRKDK